MYGTEEYYSPLEAASLQRAQQGDDQNAGEHAPAVLQQKGGAAAVSTSSGVNKSVVKISSIEAFYNAYSCLGRAANSDQLLKMGIKSALDLQRVCGGNVRLVQANRVLLSDHRAQGCRDDGRPRLAREAESPLLRVSAQDVLLPLILLFCVLGAEWRD
jgi:hypothetical protein